MEEKRKYPRVKLISPVGIREKNAIHYGIIRNISLEDITFESDRVFATFKKYRFEFTTESGKFFRINGEVCWNKELDESIVVGARFIKMGFFTYLKLKSSIKKLIKLEKIKSK